MATLVRAVDKASINAVNTGNSNTANIVHSINATSTDNNNDADTGNGSAANSKVNGTTTTGAAKRSTTTTAASPVPAPAPRPSISNVSNAAFRASLEAKLGAKPPAPTSSPPNTTSAATGNPATSTMGTSSSSLSPSSMPLATDKPISGTRRMILSIMKIGSLAVSVFNFIQICHSAMVLSTQVGSEVVGHVKEISRTTWSLEQAAQRNWLSKWMMNTLYDEEQQLQMQLSQSYRNVSILAIPLLLGLFLLLFYGGRSLCRSTASVSTSMRAVALYLALVSLCYQLTVGSLSIRDAGGYAMIWIGSEPVFANFAVQTLAGFIWDWIQPCVLAVVRRCCCSSRKQSISTSSVASPSPSSSAAASSSTTTPIGVSSESTK